MSKITITVKDGDIERLLVLRKPEFAELAMAYNIMVSGYAKYKMPDVVNAGKVLFDTCAIEGESDKAFWDTKRAELLMAACIKASEIVESFEVDLKKN